MKKKTICVVTATRAEYGLLKNVIRGLQHTEELDVRVVATGMHLCEGFGMTWREIEKDGISIDAKLDVGIEEATARNISETMARALVAFGGYFEKARPDALLVLGDRYEILSVCIAAMNQRIPIFHMCGGETTQGAVDEAIRHAITKMSYLHFTQLESYRQRVIQLGEAPERVFYVGAPGVENALHIAPLSRGALEESIGMSFRKPLGVVTFHPVTLEEAKETEEMEQLTGALKALAEEMQFIITGANADQGGERINDLWRRYVEQEENAVFVPSLGMRRYLSLLRLCSVVVGNSSSGIIEAPSFHIATVNIGDRQKGRVQAKSVINVRPEAGEIEKAIRAAVEWKKKGGLEDIVNPYGNGETSQKIVKVIREWLINEKIALQKPFYDLPFIKGEEA